MNLFDVEETYNFMFSIKNNYAFTWFYDLSRYTTPHRISKSVEVFRLGLPLILFILNGSPRLAEMINM